MKFDKKYIQRFVVAKVVAIVASLAIFVKILYTATVEHDEWKDVGQVSISNSQVLSPSRGNILSADGQLMASSLPDYKVYIDYLAGVKTRDSINTKAKAKKDSIFLANLDTISKGLARICDKYDAKFYYEHLKEGMTGGKDKQGSRYWEICPHTILNFIQYHELIKLPVFNQKNPNRSGLVVEPRNNRNKPFGSLAKRTLGEMFGAKDSARSGLELAYDDLLRGEPGMMHTKKVLSRYITVIEKEPKDGYDLVSTIDIGMQDLCESALREKLKELGADMGVVILMEVETGDVKAIVNLQRYGDGEYYEARNYALASLMEPGSTFKTASILVALDDGVIKPTDWVETYGGVVNMYGASMKDHNWHRGGYGTIDVPHVLMYSSNVGVSRLIDKHYHKCPEKFVEGLRRVGIGTPLGLKFDGAADPRIRMPKPDKSNWSATALAWMSIGYETQIPPISTVTFYNAIANGGKMVRPRFVKGIEYKGEMVEEFPVEVIKESICNPQALHDIQTILQRVVCEKDGTGKRAGTPYFHVSGKTGTAQVATGGGYKNGHNEHLVSFCGYYPSEKPRYSCIVAIRHAYPVASGGGQAGPVFSKIAQGVYSKNVTTDLSMVRDSDVVLTPDVKAGNSAAAQSVLRTLGYTANMQPEKSINKSKEYVPDVTGMGVRDAVFAMQSRGIRVRTKGCGRVKSQTLPAGSALKKNSSVLLLLE